MRQIVIVAVMLMILGGLGARYADQMLAQHKPAPPARAQAAADTSANYRSMTITAGRGGHFQVDGRANGRSIAFMVDTGASTVAVRESDAARAGVRPLPRDYTASVSTANGTIKAAPVRFDSIEVGSGIRVFDVTGIVLPDEALSENLLGLSFLSRLRRYEYANGRLVLEQ